MCGHYWSDAGVSAIVGMSNITSHAAVGIQHIHFIHFRHRLSCEGRRELEPIPADIGQEAGGYTLDRSPVYHRADTQRQTTIRPHIHTYGHSPINNGLLDKAAITGEKSHRHGEAPSGRQVQTRTIDQWIDPWMDVTPCNWIRRETPAPSLIRQLSLSVEDSASLCFYHWCCVCLVAHLKFWSCSGFITSLAGG